MGATWRLISRQLDVSFHAIMQDKLKLGKQEKEAANVQIMALEETHNT